ncbi:VOC family protein [Planobispora longispora]|uniref:Glyoxalase n=1 Tax=Planobispora longispora TaxID=28887 RepID=A0A8J3RVG3_9ACTN|nr:VOC family protein [Planobispora longispora]BFE84129.1 VOC family protein [Planobispora longispora]GIH78943.1 glyoxalase [Planobispora longispora]
MIDVHYVTFDCARPYELAAFWRDATGFEFHPETDKDDDEVLLVGKINLLFIKVPEGKTVKNRVHLDVNGTEGSTRDQEVERLLGLGATIQGDHRNPDGTGWVTMLDPEGNEFCVCRSEAEREQG